jgi:bacteriocin-like protein
MVMSEKEPKDAPETTSFAQSAEKDGSQLSDKELAQVVGGTGSHGAGSGGGAGLLPAV